MKANFDNMNMEKAIVILGYNRPKKALNNLITSLYAREHENSQSDLVNRVAAIYVVNRYQDYQTACALRGGAQYAWNNVPAGVC